VSVIDVAWAFAIGTCTVLLVTSLGFAAVELLEGRNRD